MKVFPVTVSLSLPALLLGVIQEARSQTVLSVFQGSANGQQYARAMAPAGDIDGDGTGDLIFGAPGGSWGYAQVVSGASGQVIRQVSGSSIQDGFGVSVCSLGDVDFDLVPDFAVGAVRLVMPPPSQPSYVRVFSGRTGQVLHSVSGAALNDGFGSSISSVGDLDHDGAEDLLVGAPKGDYVRVISGSSGATIFQIQGHQTGDEFGKSVAGIGDANGDGSPDFLVGAPQSTQPGAGYAILFSGADASVLYDLAGSAIPEAGSFGTAVAAIGDVDGDLHSDFVISDPNYGYSLNDSLRGLVAIFSGANASVLYAFKGPSPFFSLGTAIAGAGDINGDGFPDLLVASGSSNPYAYSGKDGSMLFTLAGPIEDSSGYSLCGVGDLNHDGLDDFLVGAPQIFLLFNPLGPGYARLYSGSKGSFEILGTGNWALAPKIGGSMLPAPGSQVTISVSSGLVGAQGVLMVGSNPSAVPWMGGALFVQPQWLFPHALTDGGFFDQGEITVPVSIPQDLLLLGQSFYFQSVYADPSAPLGVSLTPGLKMTIN